MSALRCNQCGHDNDPTRVFCQNCGMRLERPEGGEAEMASSTPVMGRSTQKPKKKFSLGIPEGGVAWAAMRILRTVLSTAILAALLALFIQLGRKPDNIPEPQKPSQEQATQLFQSIKAFGETVYPRALDVYETQANNYLASRIVSADDGGSSVRAKFERAFVVIGEGEMKFFVEQKFLGWPVYMHLNYVTGSVVDESIARNSTTIKVTGGGIGRISVPSWLVPMLEKNLQSVIDSTSDATNLLSRTSSVEFHPGVAKLSWQGSRTPGD